MTREFFRRFFPCLALVPCFALLPVIAAEPLELEDPAWTHAGASAEKLDFGLPAQAVFADWPGEEFLTRPYFTPWSWPAFKRASLFGRPVFLVLTVNWSRASRRLFDESLSDPRVLKAINEGYIPIKANADLLPPVRERYQTGGWPVVAFLLPDGLPMLSQANDLGVAKPITTVAVDPESMLFLVDEGAAYWEKWSDLLLHVGGEWAKREGPDPPVTGAVDREASEQVARWLLANADRAEGGFGAAPKFIVPGLQEYAALRATRGLAALDRHARLTLERLVASALFDSRDGGIHRVAAEPLYGGIQYEKMLVGNTHLIRELVISLRLADSAELRQALVGTVGFVTGTLAAEGGGFHQAQVADPASEDGGAYWTSVSDRRGAPPPTDPLVLSGANALAGAALIRAGMLLDDDAAIVAGREAIERVYREAYARGRGAAHSIEPAGDHRDYLVSQADVALGFVDAYETTGDRRYLDAAGDLAEAAVLNFASADSRALRDEIPGRLMIGLMRNPRMPLRPNVRMARVLRRLAVHGSDEDLDERARGILGAFAGNLEAFRVHGTQAGLAVEELLSDPLVVRISGSPDDPLTRELRRIAVNSPWPWTLVGTGKTEGAPVAELLWQGKTRKHRRGESLEEALGSVAAGGQD